MAWADTVESFQYLESPGVPFVSAWTGWEDATDRPAEGVPRPNEAVEKLTGPELQRRLAEARQLGFEAGRTIGLEDGRTEERDRQTRALEEAEQKRIAQVAGLVEQFQQERERYFRALEPEVVRLALAVAARVLRREAATDPLLLMGAVRAALGQIAAATEIRLRVPAGEIELWNEAIALLPNLAVRPAVVPADAMEVGECVLETELGSADLGLDAQLAEIGRALLGSGTAQGALRRENKAEAESVA